MRREWPNKLDHVLAGPEDLQTPRQLHPIFYGSFDWHSCVHSHWLLARLLRRYPQLGGPIRELFAEQFTPAKVEGELAYLRRPSARGFERPYGWAWLLMLQAELRRHPEGWADTLQPLAEAFVERFQEYLPLAPYPVRSGMHSCTAFALLLALEYARAGFAARLRDKALEWYENDAGVVPLEPSQADFLSPVLTEAALMRRVLGEADFGPWFRRFLPAVPPSLLRPARVTDRSDGQLAHLDGLNLSRAWCWRLIGGAAEGVIEAHLASALEHVSGDYMGEHWLASFALLALDPNPE